MNNLIFYDAWYNKNWDIRYSKYFDGIHLLFNTNDNTYELITCSNDGIGKIVLFKNSQEIRIIYLL